MLPGCMVRKSLINFTNMTHPDILLAEATGYGPGHREKDRLTKREFFAEYPDADEDDYCDYIQNLERS